MLLTLVIASCQKADSPGSGNGRLSKMVSTLDDSVGISAFSYDLNGRLAAILESVNGQSQGAISYHYNSAGQLVKTTGSMLPLEYLYTYENGCLASKKDNFSSHPQHTYAYNAQGKLIADTVYLSDKPFGYTRYTYDANNDVTEWEYFYNFSGSWESSGICKAVYSSSLNPVHNISLLFYVTRDVYPIQCTMFSRHLPVKVTLPDGSIANFNYQFLSNGLPEKVTIQNDPNSQSNTSRIEFYYE